MFKRILFICFLLSFTSCNNDNPVSVDEGNTGSTDNKWISKADMPTARGYICCAEADGKFYLFGGILDLTHPSDAVEVYDPVNNTWVKNNKMPEKILGQAAAELNGKIYVFGGRTGDLYNGTTLNYTYLYDPLSDNWTRKTDMPSPRAFVSASLSDGKIYVMGGAIEKYDARATNQMYDPATDTWTNKASLPRSRAGHTANVFSGKIYIVGGGYSHDSGPGTAFPYFDVYDPVNDSWSSKTDLSQSRIGHGAVIINDKLYVCGGFSSYTELSDLTEYDFNNDTWTTRTSMSTPRRCFATCVYNNMFLIIGGITGNIGAQQALKSVRAYIPPSSLD